MLDKIAATEIDDDCEETTPNPGALALSMRAFGYDITTAIADIIDNSITAHAKNIKVNFDWNENKSTISIVDDGFGMLEKVLVEAMRLGTTGPNVERQPTDLGRFGLGLKTASFSQCKILTVASITENNLKSCKRWDLDLVVNRNKWILLTPPQDEQEELFRKIENHGTIVEWKNLDKIFPKDTESIPNLADYFLTIADDVKNHIAMTYSSFSKGKNSISFWINERKIEMWDPFLADNSFTTLLGEEIIYYASNNKVTIRPYILPHHSKLTADEHSKAAGTRGWNDQQGFYIFRSNRLIIDGNWLDTKLEKKEAYRLARIRIDIDNRADDIWGVDVKKAKATLPASLKKDLRRIASLARHESSKVFRHRGKVVARSSDKSNSFLWEQKNKDGKYFFVINRQHSLIKSFYDECDDQNKFNMILKLLESGVPTPLIRSAESNNPNGEMPVFANLSDNDIREMFRDQYNLYIKHGTSHEKAIELTANSEPFMYFSEIVDEFRR